jgi:hypothetical protein
MSGELSLIMMGGIGDSGKSSFADAIAKRPSVRVLRVSDYLRRHLEVPTDRKLGAEVVNVDWKSRAEQKAALDLGEEVGNLRAGGCKTLIVNSHFATYSPGGFMMGMDPGSLRSVCKACELCGNVVKPVGDSSGERVRAAVVLVDIGISDVLRRREAQWQSKPAFSMGTALIQDLEFNRLYSLQYYQILSSIIGFGGVEYYRLLLDWQDIHSLERPLEQAPGFQLKLRELSDYLIERRLIEG